MKTVILYGGSFNPPHTAHFDTAAYLFSVFRPDEVWMMFSVNRLKDSSKYESVFHRMAMGNILANEYPGIPFVMSDIEEQIGTNETYVILDELKKRMPDHNFIWVMGADNLLHFHKWANAETMIQKFPMIIIERPPYNDDALNSQMATNFAHLRRDKVADFNIALPGWIFMKNPGAQMMASSDLLEKLRDPNMDLDRDFDPRFKKVAQYAIAHRLYRLGAPAPGSLILPGAPKP